MKLKNTIEKIDQLSGVINCLQRNTGHDSHCVCTNAAFAKATVASDHSPLAGGTEGPILVFNTQGQPIELPSTVALPSMISTVSTTPSYALPPALQQPTTIMPPV